jgi:SAM-dependent methyltransferase
MMSRAVISDLLLDSRELRPAGDGVWSVLPGNAPGRRYDRRAAAYDLVVGSGLYNRLFWGSSPRTYSAFAERAVRSGSGPFLDAGCGSLVFTASVYARASRPLVLVDESIGMLQAARARLARAAGHLPEGVVLLQSDLRDLPFRAGSFSTALCMGMLHLFDDIRGILPALANATQPAGQLFLTSLVAETVIGKRYLSLLHHLGEVAAPRTQDQLLNELKALGAGLIHPTGIAAEGSMAFIVGCRVGRNSDRSV